MLSVSFGVSQRKFGGLDPLSTLMNSGSLGEVAVRKSEQRDAVFISLNSRNGKWSAALGGMKLQVPEPVASSAKAFQVRPEASILSMMLGPDNWKQQLPSLVIPEVLPPVRAM